MSNAVVVHYKEHHANICAKLYEQFQDEKLTDITVRCGETSRKAHSVILAVNSSHLEDAIAKGSNEVVFPEMNKDTLDKFFEFLYLGATILEESELDSFLSAGRMLDVKGLIEIDREFEPESVDNRFTINSKEDFRSLLQKVDAAAENTSDIVLDQTQMAIRKVARGSHLAIERLRKCLMMEEREKCEEEENALTEDNLAAQMLSEEMNRDGWSVCQQRSVTDGSKRVAVQDNLHQLLVVEDENNQFWIEDSQNNDCYLLKSSEDLSNRFLSDTAREIGSDESTQEASEVDCPPSDTENDGF